MERKEPEKETAQNETVDNAMPPRPPEEAVDNQKDGVDNTAAQAVDNAKDGVDNAAPAGKPKKKGFWNQLLGPFRILGKGAGALARFEIFYRVLTFFVMVPILGGMQKVYLLVNGTGTIAWNNVLDTLKNPLTWLWAAAMLLLISFFTLVEQYALIDGFHALWCGRKLRARDLVYNGVDIALRTFRPANLLLLPYALIILRFVRQFDVSSITRYFTVPGFVLEYIDQRDWLSVVYLATNLLMLYLGLRWIFALTVMVTEEWSFPESCRRSAQLTKGPLYKLFLMVLSLVWAFIAAALNIFGTVLAFILWYLLLEWLDPNAQTLLQFVAPARFQIVSILFYLLFMWFAIPALMAGYQYVYYVRMEQLGLAIPPYREKPHYLKTKPLLAALAVCVIAVSVYYSVPSRYRQVKWMMNTNNGLPMVMAHRGYSAGAPENTIPAFEGAVAVGADAIELDVQMTKDGEIVVLHDDSIARTTGVNKHIWEVTYDEIKDLDNGSFFSEEFAGTHIPTLDQVLKTFKDRMYINIEIKRTGHDDGIEKKVVEIIRANNFLHQCDVTSQDYETLQAVRDANPDVLTAYTTVLGIGAIEDLDAADIISINESFANYDTVDRLRRAGKRVFVWTVNDEEVMAKLVSLNVDAILTNDPVLGRQVVDQHSDDLRNLYYRLDQVLWYF